MSYCLNCSISQHYIIPKSDIITGFVSLFYAVYKCTPLVSFQDNCKWSVHGLFKTWDTFGLWCISEFVIKFSSLFHVFPDPTKVSHQAGVAGGLVVDVAPNAGLGGVVGASALANMPPPYQPVNVRHLESSSSQDAPPDYLLLVNCETKKPELNR